ncbi:MAG TPA: hypothetical protein VFQ30_12655, partial [Ktedonobacteraceae bacterium]|nr:hypothetical protein [Ktedonobacteraceae bacterium]
DLISIRLLGTEKQKASILPILLEGEEFTSLPPLLHRRVHSDFRREEYYFSTLFDLILTLYLVRFDDPIVRDLRVTLHEEADELIYGRRRR